jgi:hypothetical protein
MFRFLFGSLLLAPFCAAGAVSLTNGDRITGDLVRSLETSVVIKTEYAGEVTIARAMIREIAPPEPPPVKPPPPPPPGVLDLWAGFVDLGYATARGNARTANFTLGMNAARATARDKISTYFTSLFASNATTGVSVTAANAIRSGARYERNIRTRTHAFAFQDFEIDEFQKLDLRVVSGGGFGVKVIDSPQTQWSAFSGASLNKEYFFNSGRRTSGETLFGEELAHKVNAILQIKERFVIYPNLTSTGDYRVQFDASAVTLLAKWLSWQVSLSDRFLSNPVPGARKNDILFTSGIRLTFDKTK